ncbi:tetratricopeptide repeat protein, partial [bacterium]|nr:tetratricopeptide repeat protein [bacterium]
LGLLALTVLVFGTTLFNAFVYDDSDYVVANPAVRDPGFGWRRVFTTPYPADHPEQKLYRPLVTLSYRLDQAIWGMPDRPDAAAAGFHLTNLLWHVATVLLLFSLAQRLAGPRAADTTAARREPRPPHDPEHLARASGTGAVSLAVLAGVAWFAWHPLTTESVAWVVGRAEVMAASFGLLSLLACVRARARDEHVGPWTALAWASYAGALLCKENAVMVPVLAALVHWRFRPGRARGKRWAILLAGYGLVALAYLAWRQHLFAGVGLQEQAYTGIADTATRLLVASKVLVRYLLLAVVPYRQSVFHEVRVETTLGVLALVALLGCTVWLVIQRRRFPNLLFGWAWFVVALLPVSNLAFPIGTVMAERFLYLPLTGLALAIGSALPARLPWPRWLTAMVAVILIHHGIKTELRGRDWHDDGTLWASAVRVCPDSFIVHAQLGFACRQANQPAAARAEFERALELLGRQPPVYQAQFEPRLRVALDQLPSDGSPPAVSPELEAIHQIARHHRLEEAARQYDTYLQRHPGDLPAERALADCLLNLGRFAEAAGRLRSLIGRDPTNALLHAKLGLANSQLGRVDAARRAYARAVELDPANAVTWANYGGLEMKAENYDRARTCFARAVALQPAAPEFRLNLAICYWRLGRIADARSEALTVLRLQPEHPEAQKLLGMLSAGRASP